MRDQARAEHDANAAADHSLTTVGLGGGATIQTPGPDQGPAENKEPAGV